MGRIKERLNAELYSETGNSVGVSEQPSSGRADASSPEEGLLPRGEGGSTVKSGCAGGQLWCEGDPKAGKCCRFSNPM